MKKKYSKNQSNDRRNLITLCLKCHLKRHNQN
ncbi:MAG: HNH endonuclease [Bacteroidales bacterium]|nr:HNH endonuclease [Bacteroidales bacterium]